MSALPDHTLAFQVAQELGGLPLALDQAGAYMAATRSSLAMYRSLYQGHRDRLLAKSRNPEYPASFATTWNLSFAGIEAKNLAAAELLYVCAFLAPDAIPEVMLTQGAAYLGPRLGPVLTDPFRLNEAIGVIRNYSLLTRDPSTQTLSMHRLVQVVLRDRMDAETRKEWCKRAIQVVNHSCPGIEEAEMITRDTWEQWLTHALVCATWIDQEQIISQEGTRLLNAAGVYLVYRARTGEAERLLIQALSIREQLLGPDHPDTATSLNNLARLYQMRGRYEQAESLYVRALEIREEKLGPDHPRTAQSLHNLAELYHVQGKYEQAEPLYVRALAIRKRSLGINHPDTASSREKLASLYRMQGKEERADLFI